MASVDGSVGTQRINSKPDKTEKLLEARTELVDRIFPLYDQFMNGTKFPEWFASLCSIFISLQILLIGLWVYSEPFERLTSIFRGIYISIIKIFAFQDPTDFTNPHMTQAYFCFAISCIGAFWIAFMIYYNSKFFTLPRAFLYITVILIDVVVPLFMVPSAYVAAHGIASLSYQYRVGHVAEIILGLISFTIDITAFCNTILMKSRSVVLTNLTFQLYDYSSVMYWFVMTTMLLLVSAIFKFFANWFYIILAIIHILFDAYIAYRIMFIPFYTLWRNPTCFAFAIVTILLDFNLFILYAVKSLNYDYTLILFVVAAVIAYFCGRLFFKKRIQRLKDELSYQEDVTDLNEYFDELDICKNSLTAMMYIVVGMAEICDYFVDGSMIDYITNNAHNDEGILSILLQVVTYFPSESTKLNVIYKKLIQRQKLTFINRFLIYQISKIKTRRLSSNSKDTLKTYNRLKAMNDDCRLAIQGFWDRSIVYSNWTTAVKTKIRQTKTVFEYTILNNPNNIRIINEYVNFLIEVQCNFTKAIKESIKADEILEGKNFNVDLSFRSLVYKFPRYLQDGVVDAKGNKLMKESLSKSNNNSANIERKNSDFINLFLEPNQQKNGTQTEVSIEKQRGEKDIYIDAESEEQVGKRILKEAKVRLSLHHSIDESRPWHVTYITIFAIIIFILQMFIFCGYTYFTNSLLIWRRSNYADLQSMGNSIFYLHYSNFFTIVEWATKEGFYNSSDALLQNISIDTNRFKPLIDSNLSAAEAIFKCAMNSHEGLRSILAAAASLAEYSSVLSSQYSAYQMATHLLRSDSIITTCENGKPDENVTASLKDQIILMIYDQNIAAGSYNENEYPDNLFTDENYCSIMANMFAINDNAMSVIDSILSYNIGYADSYNSTFLLMVVGITSFIFLISIVPYAIIFITYRKMINRILKILLSLPNTIKEQAKEPLATDYIQSSEIGSAQGVTDSGSRAITNLIYITITVLLCIVFILMSLNTMKLNNECTNLVYWFYFSVKQNVLANEIGNNVIQFILFSGNSINQSIKTVSQIKDRISTSLDMLMDINDIMLNGNDTITKSVGWSNQLDQLQVGNPCDLGRNPQTLHDMYACYSVNQLLVMFENMVTNIINDPSKYGGAINTEYTANFIHLLQVHLYPGIISVSNKIASLMESNYDSRVLTTIITLIIGIFVTVLSLLMSIVFRFYVLESYRMVLILIKRLPPRAIIDNKDIINFFRGFKETSQQEAMPISKSIVYGANECIIITNQNSIVEIINPSVSENLGLTADQMLGQQITNFIVLDYQEMINQQIELMKNGQGSAVWQDHIEFIKDRGGNIPFAVTMIAMKDNEDDEEINSIVFILNNEIEEIKKRKDAELAKAKSEKLLYQILPKDIVVRLNRGEKDISFTIPKATIFFVDIVKFSQYAASLTPSEIMSNLSLVFTTFDKIVVKYPTITKIKLIGDVYMAAAGLFEDQQESPTKAAEESINCCIDIVKSMDKINTKLSASLEIRIGINSGGPLIGGVLGNDKPAFDIIGDPINIAARLQSTDIPGRVQISQDTKELIAGCNFIIEERGEVFLKGKGNRTTYFVTNQNRSSVSLEESFAINMFSGKIT